MLQNDTHPYIFTALNEDPMFKKLKIEEKISVFNFFVAKEPAAIESTVDFQNAMYVLKTSTIEELKIMVFDALLRLDIDA